MAQATAQRNKFLLLIMLIAALVLGLLAVVAVTLIPILSRLPSAAADPTDATLPPPDPNPYIAEDFLVDGNGYITCTAAKTAMGIDVSEFQGQIDWQQVKEAGVEFAMIRVGGRGWGESGNLYADNRARSYYEGAKAAGIRVGVYFFSQATSVAEAIEEAMYTLYLIAGWELDMPVVYDWEWVNSEARTAKVTRSMLMDCTVAFCEVIKAAGYEPMIYFNQNQGKNLLHLEQLKEYKWWLAMYTDAFTYPYQVDFWQYSRSGTVPGISTDVDLNIWFINES